MRSDPGYGSGRSKTAFTTLKMAVFAPMPSASVRTVTAVKPGFFPSMRAAYRRSCQMVSIFIARRLRGGEIHITGSAAQPADQHAPRGAPADKTPRPQLPQAGVADQ